MAPAVASCHACGKSGAKLLRCGRCRHVWFCNRVCQVVAASQGHSGANCRAADNAPTAHKAADAEAAPRLPAAAGPSTTEPVSDTSTMAPAVASCHACGKSGAKLLRCGRCRNVWFCNRECQLLARNRKELGHMGANCRPASETQQSRLPSAGFSHPSMQMDVATLFQSYCDLMGQGSAVQMSNTRIGSLAAVERCQEAATVADLIGGAAGAGRRAEADSFRTVCLLCLGQNAAAARAACSSLRAARASGDMTKLAAALVKCGDVAGEAPGEMVSAERESREQERLSGSPSYGGFDLSQAGRVSLPTTPAALSRLGLAFYEAAVGLCDAALAAAGGRGSPAADDEWRVPDLHVEARVRGSLGACLLGLREEQQRSLDLLRQAVALLRQVLRTGVGGPAAISIQQGLANRLVTLGVARSGYGSEGMAEAELCLREALALCESIGFVNLNVKTLRCLINVCGVADATVGPAEAEAFRSRLNQLLFRMGRSVETNCSICLEPLAPPTEGVAEYAAGGRGGAVGPSDSCVRVLGCDHQYHHGCITTWQRKTFKLVCPMCKK